jgi:hypothetical protein
MERQPAAPLRRPFQPVWQAGPGLKGRFRLCSTHALPPGRQRHYGGDFPSRRALPRRSRGAYPQIPHSGTQLARCVIGLPANIFYGTGIPTCILVFKKCRENPNDILFIDASTCFEKGKNQNFLRPRDIDRIVNTWRGRIVEEKFSHRATLDEIAENDYNLNIPRYVDTFEEEEPVDLGKISEHLTEAEYIFQAANNIIVTCCNELGIKPPNGSNYHLLKLFKRGIIQKIFSQELRFKADRGCFFPDWEKRKLGDFLLEHREQVPANTDLPIYSSSRRGLKLQRDYFDNREVNNEGEYGVVPYGYFTYRHMSDDITFKFNINLASEKIAVSKEYPVFKTENMDSIFLLNLLNNSNEFKRFAATQKLGGTRTRLYYKNLCSWKTLIPVLEEQQKIAKFLSAIDAKIDAVSGQIERMEQFKKGLLQQMFV